MYACISESISMCMLVSECMCVCVSFTNKLNIMKTENPKRCKFNKRMNNGNDTRTKKKSIKYTPRHVNNIIECVLVLLFLWMNLILKKKIYVSKIEIIAKKKYWKTQLRKHIVLVLQLLQYISDIWRRYFQILILNAILIQFRMQVTNAISFKVYATSSNSNKIFILIVVTWN